MKTRLAAFAGTVRRIVMMFLFMVMVPVELLLLAANWIVALISPSMGKRFMEWNIRTLPDKDFYHHNSLLDRNDLSNSVGCDKIEGGV